MEKWNIAFICDDNYCMPTIVTIQSIMDNTKANKDLINYHVCTFGLTVDNCNKLKSLSDNVFIHFFNESEYQHKLEGVIQRSHVTPAALIKFELANYFKNLDRILYIDSDIIIKKDISALMSLDIEGHYLAAAFEYWEYIRIKKYSFKTFSLPENFYFNSGVMLINLKKFREVNLSQKLWYFKTHLTKTTLMDQETLNEVCKGLVLPLNIKWNFNPLFYDNSELKGINEVWGSDYRTREELFEDVCIIHYVGAKDKPWVYKTARFRGYWEKSFVNSGLKDNLSLMIDRPVKLSLLQSVHLKCKSHGITGFIAYCTNRLFKRF